MRLPSTSMPSRYSTSRQKVCRHCSAAKAKCDQKVGGCSRCLKRGLDCALPAKPHKVSPLRNMISERSTTNNLEMRSNVGVPRQIPEPEQTHLESTRNATGDESISADAANSITPSRYNTSASHGSSTSHDANKLDFTKLDLACPIDADAISNRWLNTFVPIPGQAVKNYPPRVTAFIHRNLKAYASSVVHNRSLPPFIHPAQRAVDPDSFPPPPLSTCLSLTRICEHPAQLDHDMLANIFTLEMSRLCDRSHTFGPLALLEAFQSYLLYIMVLYFNLEEGSNSFLREAMMNLQDIASSACQSGIMCTAELREQHARPKWEAWILAESTRRTMYVMTLLDSLLATQDGLPTFLAAELRGLPAPQSKQLWQAQGRREWETKYNVYLAEWPDGPLCIDELWPTPSNLDANAVLERQRRVNQWLEGVDEFGMMLYAVTCCTHES